MHRIQLSKTSSSAPPISPAAPCNTQWSTRGHQRGASHLSCAYRPTDLLIGACPPRGSYHLLVQTFATVETITHACLQRSSPSPTTRLSICTGGKHIANTFPSNMKITHVSTRKTQQSIRTYDHTRPWSCRETRLSLSPTALAFEISTLVPHTTITYHESPT